MRIADHIERIRSDINNPEPYLVFADWLQERGDPWGQLIVLQQQLDKRPGDHVIGAAIDALVRRHRWIPKHKAGSLRLHWKWGFIRTLHIFDIDDRGDLTTVAGSIGSLPMGQLLRRCGLFRDRAFEFVHDNVAQLRKALPSAQVQDTWLASPHQFDARYLRRARALVVDDHVPNSIARCTHLTWLICRGVPRLPSALGDLPLERLDIGWCRELQPIPDEIWGIESLGHISMHQCDGLHLDMVRVNSMLAGFIRARTPREQRIVEARLLCGGASRDVLRLLRALDSNVAFVRDRALDLLDEAISPPNPRIDGSSVVAMVGRFHLDRTELKRRLMGMGATVVSKITEATTHVLVGSRPDGAQLELGDRFIVLERQLTAMSSVIRGEAAARPTLESSTLELSSELRSRDDSRVAAAVRFLGEAGRIPPGLLPELFCVLQDVALGKQGNARTRATRLFAAYAPVALRRAVSLHLKTSILRSGDFQIAERLEALARDAGSHIDITRVARILFEDHGRALRYLVERGDQRLLRSVLMSRIENRCLDISGMALSDMPDLSAFDLVEVNAANNNLTSFPEALGVLPHLARLDLSANSFWSLPSEISGFVCLEELNLSRNCFRFFPSGVLSLSSLQELDLSSGARDEIRIDAIPRQILALERLRVLRMKNRHRAVEVPWEIAQMTTLKHLAVTWRHDQLDRLAALKKQRPDCQWD